MATGTDVATAEDAVHDDHGHDNHDDHAKAPAATLPRGRSLQVGAAFFTAATVMYFGGLFAIYLSERRDHLMNSGDAWIPDAVRVELTAPTIMAWTLLISIPTMHWAVYSFKRDDRRHGLLALLVQAVYAGAVINQHAFQWKQLGLVSDVPAGGSNAPVLIYAITISFVVAMGIALVALLLVGFRALSGASSRPHTDAAASVAVYWYALVAVYFVIWILIFITK